MFGLSNHDDDDDDEGLYGNDGLYSKAYFHFGYRIGKRSV